LPLLLFRTNVKLAFSHVLFLREAVFCMEGYELKRILLAVTLVTLSLTACEKASQPKELEKDFTCTATIMQNDTEYKAELERIDGAGWKAVFTSPETIEGLEIALLNDKCTVSYKELTYTANREDLPQYGLLDLTAAAIDTCIAGKTTSEMSEDEFTLSGEVRELDFTAVQQGSEIKSLEISDITVTLEDYS